MVCPDDGRLASREFLNEALSKARGLHIPISGAFDLTYRCGFRCVHCYARHLVEQPASAANELSTSQVKDLLNQAADAGCLSLLLSGGDPLLRSDFAEIYETARCLGMLVTVFTNASLVRPEHVEVLGAYAGRVEVSVYGATEDTYERVTGRPDSYRRVWAGIEALLAAGVHVVLKTAVLRENIGEIPAIEARAADLGLDFRMDPLITPRLDGDRSPGLHRVAAHEAVALELCRKESRIKVAKYWKHRRDSSKGCETGKNKVYNCGAGVFFFHLDPQGRLRPCVTGTHLGYDVTECSFGMAWQQVVHSVKEVEWAEQGKCGACRLYDLCQPCGGLMLMEGASSSDPPRYLCELWEARFRAIQDEIEEVEYGDVTHAII
jgi:radical SAM protein with 4Fe4S-binding SPASM domain